jgi:hypothetical protein
VRSIGADDDHELWSELSAGYVMSALDDADQASYLEHAANCPICRQLELDFTEVLADVAHATAAMVPPPALKASIMRAIAEDDANHASPVVSITDRSVVGQPMPSPSALSSLSERRAPRARRLPGWLVAAAAFVVVGAIGVGVGVATSGGKPASVAARCAKVNCPIVPLTSDGTAAGDVMVLGQVAYLDASGLPATPAGESYVLWYIAGGHPVGVAAVRTLPTSGPVSAGSLPVPLADVTGFAVSEEPGSAVPKTPSHVVAQGSLA